VLEPIDPTGMDVAEADLLVRGRMQEALDELARQRKLPVLG
jgi:hypothetical protein